MNLPDSPSDWQDRSDHELVRLLAEGRREALAALVQRHQAAALRLAYRFLGRWEAAEDICQEAFIRVFEAAAEYRPTAAFTTWLYRIVANLCWDRRRRAAREPASLSEDADRLCPAPSTGTPSETAERAARVQNAIAELPDRQRLVLILHRYSDLSYKEIEQVTGWSAGAVESCLMRAYARLREVLADLGGKG